ncbi:MAG: hypothetical protein NVSMB47_12480 [Polyangiales bacterium]
MPERREPAVVEALAQARAALVASCSDDPAVRALIAAIDQAAAGEGTTDRAAAQDHEALQREIERLRLEARGDHALLDAVLRQSPHGVLVCDAAGRLVLHNRAAERIWAGSATTASIGDWGRYRAFHADGRPYAPTDWAMARCLSRGEVVEAEEVHFQRFDDTHGLLLGSCAPLIDARGTITGAVSFFADITPFKQLEHLKDRWVAVASHEIRNFLAVMKIRVDMAQRATSKDRPVDLPETLSVLGQSVDGLNALVSDMLDLSRAQAGTLPIQPIDVPVDALVRKVVDPLLAGSPGHSVELDLQPTTALVDPLRCEQVLHNLIGNALRYSPAGGRITVTVDSVDGYARVRVVDPGIGFEPGVAESLFDPFVRLSNLSSASTGLGVGLYLARELVHRMGGSIGATSAGLGKGATFRFTLPLGASASARTP